MNEDKVIMTIVKLEADMVDVKETLANINGQLGSLTAIMQSQDKMVKLLVDMKTEQVANKYRNDNMEERIETLETEMEQVKRHLQMA